MLDLTVESSFGEVEKNILIDSKITAETECEEDKPEHKKGQMKDKEEEGREIKEGKKRR